LTLELAQETQKQSNAVSNANLGAKNEGVVLLESDGRLDDDESYRVR
jgi:flagellar hook assembly protein FlgD